MSDIVGEQRIGIGMGLSETFKQDRRKYKCNLRCPYLTKKPSCIAPAKLLHTCFVKYGQFGGSNIIKGKYGEGCQIYLHWIKGTKKELKEVEK